MSKNTLEIIYEDADIVIVNKPSNFLTIPDRFKAELPNLFVSLRELYGEILVVHRLDKETSGVICFARNAAAHRHLSMQFEAHTVQKKYWALVDGIVVEKEGTIDAAMEEHPTKLGQMVVFHRGKPSVTDYKVIQEFRNYTIVEASPKTGRQHQIRVHLAHIGNPLAVDSLYGQRKQLLLSEFKKRKFKIGKWDEEQPILARTPLHAFSLTFVHPTTLQEMTVEAPLSKDLRAVTSQLEKWNAL